MFFTDAHRVFISACSVQSEQSAGPWQVFCGEAAIFESRLLARDCITTEWRHAISGWRPAFCRFLKLGERYKQKVELSRSSTAPKMIL